VHGTQYCQDAYIGSKQVWTNWPWHHASLDESHLVLWTKVNCELKWITNMITLSNIPWNGKVASWNLVLDSQTLLLSACNGLSNCCLCTVMYGILHVQRESLLALTRSRVQRGTLQTQPNLRSSNCKDTSLLACSSFVCHTLSSSNHAWSIASTSVKICRCAHQSICAQACCAPAPLLRHCCVSPGWYWDSARGGFATSPPATGITEDRR